MTLPEHASNVLPAIREMHSKDPTVVDMDPWYLAQDLYDFGYLTYLPSLITVEAAQDLLLIERGMGDVYDVASLIMGPSTPQFLMKDS